MRKVGGKRSRQRRKGRLCGFRKTEENQMTITTELLEGGQGCPPGGGKEGGGDGCGVGRPP